jgi:hypothetical protein
MREIRVGELRPGMALSQAIFSPRGELLLRANVPLSERHVTHLRNLGCATVYVAEAGASDYSLGDVLAGKVRERAAVELGRIHEAVGGALAPARSAPLERLTAELGSGDLARAVAARVDGAVVDRGLARLLDDLLATEILVGLNAVRAVDASPLVRALDAAAVAVAIGRRLDYRGEALRRLARGCLLKDVGMLLLDPAALATPGRLGPRERALVRVHPLLGYQILGHLRPFDLLANHVAYQHHERQNGGGYPRALHGTNRIYRQLDERPPDGGILLDAEIAAVADVYVALSGGRGYRPPLPPDRVVRTLWRLAGTHLNRQLVAQLVAMLPVHPLGTTVIVTSGRYQGYRGLVCRVRPRAGELPCLRLIYDAEHRRVDPIELDLAQTGDQVASAPLPRPALSAERQRSLREARAVAALAPRAPDREHACAAAQLALASIAIVRHHQQLA